MPSRIHERRINTGFPGSSFKYTPLLHVRVLFVSFVQGLFAEAPANAYRWHKDDENSQIYISDENPIRTDVIGKRPAISFTRGPIQFYSLGMDDMLDYNQALDKKTKGILVPGTMSINCCSKSDLESEALAWIIAEHIWLLRELFLKEGFFELGRDQSISSPSKAEDIVVGDQADEWFCTAITVPWQFARKSSFTPLGKKIIDSIQLNFKTQRNLVASQGPAIPGFQYPIAETACPVPSFAPNASDAQGQTPDPARTQDYLLTKVPHPLNPAATVKIRAARNNRAGIRPPSINGVTIPIADPCVKESTVTPLSVIGTAKV